jgi:hypothetical protein
VAKEEDMHRRLSPVALTLVVIAAMGTFASAASAKEHVAPVKVHFTEGPEGGGEYFGEANTLTCHGVHITNAKFPGAINPKNGRIVGGEEITRCKLAKGETFPARWQTPGQPINIDGNFWVSGYDGQGVPFSDVIYSKVSAHDNAFVVKVVYPIES